MTNKISAIIPCYNSAAFLREAIDSALSQTRALHEIIVVDNASTDGSAEITAGYGDRVRVLRSTLTKGTGGGATHNRGVCLEMNGWLSECGHS